MWACAWASSIILYSWHVKIHDLCKVSCICSFYAFGFIMHFPSLWKMIFFEKWHFLVVSKKQPIVFTKQPIVLPLAHLNKAVMNSYASLQLFLFFHNPLWVKNAFTMPLNQIIKRCIICFIWNSMIFMNGNHTGGHGVDEYLWMWLHLKSSPCLEMVNGKENCWKEKGKIGGLCVVILHSYGVLKTTLDCCCHSFGSP